ncbi:MAG: alcohol dehydrogenase catalytic domain-containing protein, partial [Candidatus Aminicenantes bacterium]|nr:alcohol dehydrogenase catalytic domain-containing protein [Candidatus Aminicenantes bacterium]
MKAMVMTKVCDLRLDKNPLDLREVSDPKPGDDELLLKVRACAVCHTELDEIEGRTPPPRLPVVPGHQVVGVVETTGRAAVKFKPG